MPLGAARFGLLGGVADLGKLKLIETKDISGVSKSIFSSIQESTYNVHLLVISDVSFSASSQIRVRLYESGVEETASVYQYAYLLMESTGGFSEIKSTAVNYMTYTTFNNGQRNQYIYFYNLGDSSKYSFCTTHSSEWDGKNTNIFGSGVLPQASTVDGISLTSGTTVSGQASLYGIAES